MLYSLPPECHKFGGILLANGTPLDTFVSRQHKVAVVLVDGPGGPVPDWLNQFNGQSGTCRIHPAVLPARVPEGLSFQIGDLLLFEGGKWVRGVHHCAKHPIDAIAKFVYDSEESLRASPPPRRPPADADHG